MKLRAAACIVAVVILITLFSSSLGADGPLPRPASPNTPALVIEPNLTRGDPAILWDPVSHLYRLYATETWFAFVPMWVAKKITGPWHYTGNVLPALPAWHGQYFSLWAPEVHEVNGVWTLWASQDDVQGNKCMFRATAKSPAGPFKVDPRRVPCDTALNGDIDPTPEFIDGQWWFMYKTNANNPMVHQPTTIFSQRIGADGMPYGPRVALLTSTQPWEGGLVESPNFVQDPGSKQWWLVFSSGRFDKSDPTYQIYTVPCDGPAGPCHIDRVVLLVRKNAQGLAPGEQFAFTAPDGQAWVAYNPDGPFLPPGIRPLALVKLDWDAQGEPYVVTP
jgi:arabinan endo-1,5-alpha-L-arabinosidase